MMVFNIIVKSYGCWPVLASFGKAHQDRHDDPTQLLLIIITSQDQFSITPPKPTINQTLDED